jgi:hypothetical protein
LNEKQAISGILAVLVVGLGLLLWPLVKNGPKVKTAEFENNLIFDPFVQEILTKGNAKCPDSESSFIWVCGAILELDGPGTNNLCSSHDAPRFVGNLGDWPLQWSWWQRYPMPGVEGQFYTFYPYQSTSKFDKTRIPENLPDEPPAPDFKNTERFGEALSWAKLDGQPILFHFFKYLDLKPAPHRCIATARHKSLPIEVTVEIPCSLLGNWRNVLYDAMARIDKGMLSFNTHAQCNRPPTSVRFDVEPTDAEKIKAILASVLGTG